MGNICFFLFTAPIYILKYIALGEVGDYSLLLTVQISSWGHPASYLMCTGGPFLEGKAAQMWSWPSPPSGANIQNGWSYTLNPLPHMPVYHARQLNTLMSGLRLFLYDEFHLPSILCCSVSSSAFKCSIAASIFRVPLFTFSLAHISTYNDLWQELWVSLYIFP